MSRARFNPSAISLWLAVAAVALMILLPARQAWLINAWSLEYLQHAFGPATKQAVLPKPPAGHPQATLWLAIDALKSGNPALAETLVAPRIAQGDKYAMHVMADAFLAQGNFAGAVTMWQQIGDVPSLWQAASLAQGAGQMENALIAYEAVWRLNPELGTLWLATLLLDNKQDYGRAEYVLRQSLATFPNSKYRPDWDGMLGSTLQAQKRWDEAATAYESAIVLAPDDWSAYIGLGWAKYDRGDGLQAAMSEFQKATSIPESQGNGQHSIAQALVREKQFEKADAWFAQAVSLNPESRWWYAERGNAAWQAGNTTLALKVYQDSLRRFPDFAYGYYQIAYAYQLNKQPAQAVAAIEQAVALMTLPNANYYTRAGSIYEWAGDTSRALQAYRQALLIDPQNTSAIKGVQRLAK